MIRSENWSCRFVTFEQFQNLNVSIDENIDKIEKYYKKVNTNAVYDVLAVTKRIDTNNTLVVPLIIE